MNRGRRLAVGSVVAMAATAGLGQVGRPTVRVADSADRVDLEAMFPEQFGVWRIDKSVPVILPAPDVQATLDKIYNQVLSRTYVRPDGRRVMLSVAYGGDKGGGMSIHRPEICYPAQGFRILSRRVEQLTLLDRTIEVQRVDTRLGSRREPVSYWVVIGDRVVATGLDQKIVEMRFGLRNLIPDGFLMRVSTIDPDPLAGWQVQDTFLRDIVRAMAPVARERLLGSTGQEA